MSRCRCKVLNFILSFAGSRHRRSDSENVANKANGIDEVHDLLDKLKKNPISDEELTQLLVKMNKMWNIYKWRPTKWFSDNMGVYKSIMMSTTKFDSRVDIKNLLTKGYVCTPESVEPPLNLIQSRIGLPPKSMWFNRHTSKRSLHDSISQHTAETRVRRTPVTKSGAKEKLRGIIEVHELLSTMDKNRRDHVTEENVKKALESIHKMWDTYKWRPTRYWYNHPTLWDSIMKGRVSSKLKTDLKDIMTKKYSCDSVVATPPLTLEAEYADLPRPVTRPPTTTTPPPTDEQKAALKVASIKMMTYELERFKQGRKTFSWRNLNILKGSLERMLKSYDWTATEWFSQNPDVYEKIIDARIDDKLKSALTKVIGLDEEG